MAPTYRPGDVLLWRRGRRGLRAGRVVVVQLPGDRPLGVKRLGQPHGDGWELLSDNAAAGTDSRHFGPVPEVDVLGPVLLRLYRIRTR
jgi:phage repressor protein C with HTH and peptisase S24 domain